MTLPLMEVLAPHVTILYGTRSKIQIPVYRNQRTRMFDVNACVQISSPLKKVGKRDLPIFLGELVSLAGQQALYLKDIS